MQFLGEDLTPRGAMVLLKQDIERLDRGYHQYLLINRQLIPSDEHLTALWEMERAIREVKRMFVVLGFKDIEVSHNGKFPELRKEQESLEDYIKLWREE